MKSSELNKSVQSNDTVFQVGTVYNKNRIQHNYKNVINFILKLFNYPSPSLTLGIFVSCYYHVRLGGRESP